jgi:transposase InsO family protein
LGISKQAVQQYAKQQVVYEQRLLELIVLADLIREEHPGCGVEKLYYTLQPDFIGRDKFIDLFMRIGFRVKRDKNYIRTTYSVASQYPNLIKGVLVNRPSCIWQSDITYIRVGDRFYYAVFIIDVYTKQIVGYNVCDNMRATANIAALKIALKKNQPPMIHHSDRGSQYICKDYLKLLEDNNCQVSMATTAQDNAYAERINRTIKEEYLRYWKPKNFEQLRRQLSTAVKHYNQKRLHSHLERMTPNGFQRAWIQNTLRPIPEFHIFNNLENKE